MPVDRKFVIFDLDGTLIDSFECVLRCVNKALTSYGLPNVILPKTTLPTDIEIIFNKAKEILQHKVTWDDFKSFFDSIHLNNCLEDIHINPIANNLLRKYYDKGYTIIIITNKLTSIAEKICNTLFCNINVSIIGRTSSDSIKNRWAYIVERISDLDLSLGDCLLYIGDSDADSRLAEQLSVKFYDINDFSSKLSTSNNLE